MYKIIWTCQNCLFQNKLKSIKAAKQTNHILIDLNCNNEIILTCYKCKAQSIFKIDFQLISIEKENKIEFEDKRIKRLKIFNKNRASKNKKIVFNALNSLFKEKYYSNGKIDIKTLCDDTNLNYLTVVKYIKEFEKENEELKNKNDIDL
ncbi:hypothetical protein B10834_16590 [Campylobacter jejuni]|uniref:Uncharacterized protein n=1 Tax=Campylobacter jejuni TaxID=197 RepID=A0AAN3QXH0_CAMJU|nr:hypothetical protein [Campylobacter jejuni]EAI9739265.1 hypothetical protein [Campylobacter jejuni]EAK2198251.1 hypothetical protein [Campylobacter jejuni]EAK3496119.1 hypothetical protein [Campylobacter jejuni]ECP8663449.1 hypothetical protein [Campylobacter jejuni]ECP9001630.1 hypothetical protein [Campylobacter jejuni]